MQKLYKPLLFSVSLIPFGVLIYNGFRDNLTANPIEYITHYTGDWTLYFLLITLSITPLRNLTGKLIFTCFRRMLGLFAFFYACLHFLTYFVLDQYFDFNAIIEDIIDRPYITVGFTAFVLLIPLAVTSTKKMISRLGSNWQRLHKLIYVITTLAILHYLWLVKADTTLPITFALIFSVLMTLRLPWAKNVKKFFISEIQPSSH